MAKEKKTIKGGFRSTLALLIAIIALILSIMAFNRTGGQADLENRIKNLNEKIKTIKEETSVQMKKVLKATGEGLEKLSKDIEKKGQQSETPKDD